LTYLISLRNNLMPCSTAKTTKFAICVFLVVAFAVRNLTKSLRRAHKQTSQVVFDQVNQQQEPNATATSLENFFDQISSQATLEEVEVQSPGNLSNSAIYFCGYEKNVKGLYEHLYPEIKARIRNATVMTRDSPTDENTILLSGSEGDCGMGKLKGNWLEQNFKGTVIIINGESWTVRNTWKNLSDTLTIPRNQYHIGHIADGCQSRRIYFMAQEFLRQRKLWDFFLRKQDKPISTKERFLVYTNGHCVNFRDDAFDAIALAHPSKTVEHAGSCSGTRKNITNIVKSDLKFGPYKLKGKNLYLSNWKLMRRFRFCLVMENSYVEGYITEKILLAFAGGCIPIYYGTIEIFDIFNPKSFIYYDIHNPQVALDKIARLEGNATAYNEVMREPILLEGNTTIQKYFSLSDRIIPDAVLKKRIRTMVHTRCKR